MDDDRPTLITIPTELERGDAFVVLSVGAGIVMVCWWALQRGAPFWGVMVPALVAVVWMLTSRSATEVRGIGQVAVFARNKLGERDVHEWLLAFNHYYWLAVWPVWRETTTRWARLARGRAGGLLATHLTSRINASGDWWQRSVRGRRS